MTGAENGEKPFCQQNSFKPSNIRKKSVKKTDIFTVYGQRMSDKRRIGGRGQSQRITPPCRNIRVYMEEGCPDRWSDTVAPRIIAPLPAAHATTPRFTGVRPGDGP
ncbi:hypothetical protein AVEN_147729-1 [Araneus ventricosus]|uniref:Uncharacterized protein n=1 Tax=Araneus ventricosus TaxID=182803 RepID=A0A4Y2MPZ9_ARAVE|nr:hypothetical protein AVEN_147729-1 [Araneus ventricosus]